MYINWAVYSHPYASPPLNYMTEEWRKRVFQQPDFTPIVHVSLRLINARITPLSAGGPITR